ncbi:ABC transporter ATP-binding protein [Kribbella sp. NPDC051620]|uniref:ABC transporter ATP-binding protein n=1 Tax=Kribbella sp. NPDC051620 TaxID=3364120 RepID=UPI003797020F
MAGIEIEGLATVYPNGVRAVDGLDLSVADGEFFALLGPSGCGKTTLLRTIAGLESATEGSVRIDSADVTRLEPGKRGVAMVFQDYALFPHMTVSENITYPLKVRRVAAATRSGVASRTAGELSLQGLLERRPGQLSGGQQQRVALARAIASEGKVLLLDEPLSNLDARLRLEARTFLKKLQRDLGITTVFVTHDQAEALALADRIAVMQSGKLRQLGTPREVFARPTNTFVANFIGSTPMNLLPGVVTSGPGPGAGSAGAGSASAGLAGAGLAGAGSASWGAAGSESGSGTGESPSDTVGARSGSGLADWGAAGSESVGSGAGESPSDTVGARSGTSGISSGTSGISSGTSGASSASFGDGWGGSSGLGVVSVAGGWLPAAISAVPAGAEVTVGIRPEYLTLSTGDVAGPCIRGSVVVAENLGTMSLVSVECDGVLVGVTVPEEDEPAPGTPVVLTAPAQRVLLYHRESGELLARQPAVVG